MREAKSIPEGPGKAPGPGHLRDGTQVGYIHLHNLRLLVEAHLEKSIKKQFIYRQVKKRSTKGSDPLPLHLSPRSGRNHLNK